MNVVRFLLCLGLLLAGSSVSHAAFTFLGPTPYRSAADSPFNLSGLGTTFFLEDFEDDVLTPGLESGFPGSIFPISDNSVDADDGVLDGLDSGGQSVLAFPPDACSGPNCTVYTQWNFNNSAFGKYPTAIGFVLTANSGSQGTVSVIGFGENGYEFVTFDFEGIISRAFDASDDWFIGITNPFGMYSVTFEQLRRPIPGTTTSNPSFDHLRYGLHVPEPSAFLLASLALSCYPGRGYCWA